MNLKTRLEIVVKQTELAESEIMKLVETQITELSGLIDEEGALIIVAKDLGIDFNKIEKVSEKQLKLFSAIVNNRSLKTVLYNNAEKGSTGYIKQFRFSNEVINEDLFTTSGKNFVATVFVLNIKKTEVRGNPMIFVNLMVFTVENEMPKIVSVIPCKFCSRLGNMDSLHSVFRLNYTEKRKMDEDIYEHIGSLEFLKKIKKTKQAKLIE
jgi:hypothetical protein